MVYISVLPSTSDNCLESAVWISDSAQYNRSHVTCEAHQHMVIERVSVPDVAIVARCVCNVPQHNTEGRLLDSGR